MPLPDGTVGTSCDSSDMTSDARPEAPRPPDPSTLDLPVLQVPEGDDHMPPYDDDRGNTWDFGVCLVGNRLLCGWHAGTGEFEAFADLETMGWALRAYMESQYEPRRPSSE